MYKWFSLVTGLSLVGIGAYQKLFWWIKYRFFSLFLVDDACSISSKTALFLWVVGFIKKSNGQGMSKPSEHSLAFLARLVSKN